jgi:hypothetical protein
MSIKPTFRTPQPVSPSRPATAAEYHAFYRHILVDPTHPMHGEMSSGWRALAIAEAGSKAHEAYQGDGVVR